LVFRFIYLSPPILFKLLHISFPLKLPLPLPIQELLLLLFDPFDDAFRPAILLLFFLESSAVRPEATSITYNTLLNIQIALSQERRLHGIHAHLVSFVGDLGLCL
jgi:hypothetical protein